MRATQPDNDAAGANPALLDAFADEGKQARPLRLHGRRAALTPRRRRLFLAAGVEDALGDQAGVLADRLLDALRRPRGSA